MDFKNKTVIITGGAGGIGSETALLFAKNGANIVINYLTSVNEAEKLVKSIKKMGTEAISFKADISNPEKVQSMINEIIKKYEKIDILVNNASKHPPPMFDFENPDWILWKQMTFVNIMGILICSHFSAPFLRKTNGNIVNVVMDYDPGGLGYVLTKTAGTPLTRGLARQLAPVRVNAVSPGVIETWKMSKEEKESWLPTILLKRIGQPLDIAKTILFLASEAASYITGETIHVDGGRQLMV